MERGNNFPGSRPVLKAGRLVSYLAAFLVLSVSLPVAAQPSAVSWSDALKQEAGWYGSAEAVRIGDNVLLYQHPNGGWGKNVDMARVLSGDERARIERERGETETMIDNGATYTQVRYLAAVYGATGAERFREGAIRGIDYLLEAQYENGGWPQVYPLRGGYSEHVTFNDDAMIGVMRLLREASEGRAPFAFLDAGRRDRAARAIEKGLDVILKAQVEVDGTLTAWGAQHGRDDLLPKQARSYELPSLASRESVGIVAYLMEIEAPGPEVVRAIRSAVRWLERAKLTGLAVVERKDPSLPRGYDRVVAPDLAGPPLWARFYEIGTNRPMFVGRDGVVRDSLSQIEHERRVGYSWLAPYARRLLEERYPAWCAKWCRERPYADGP